MASPADPGATPASGPEARPLAGHSAVITGGGRGIGAAIARRLAREGAAIAVSARSVEQIEAVAEELRRAGHRAVAIACDVTDPAQVQQLATRATEELGRIDVLINNAGVASSAPLKALTLEEWNRLFAVNATSTFLCTQAFLPGMLAGGWGRVVNVASIAGLTSAPYITAYSAAKHAVVGFTRCLAAEVAERGVTVNAVCPGYVDTDMARFAVDRIMAKTGMPEDQAVRHLVGTNPQGRLLAADEVAHLVASLCHPLAAGIHGQAIAQDGGALLA